MIEPGLSARITFTVDDTTTAIALRSGDVPVLGTPKLVALIEEAAVAALVGRLPADSTTVGTHVALDHLAPTAVGGSVIATATVTAVDGRTVSFAGSVMDGDTEVATATHTRVVVDKARFTASVGI